jgi:hypothetical protein
MTRTEENFPISKTCVCDSGDPHDSITTKSYTVVLRGKKIYGKGYASESLYST